MLKEHELIRQCRAYLDESQLECAHGLCHCEAVARDAGAIVLVEGRMQSIDRVRDRTALYRRDHRGPSA